MNETPMSGESYDMMKKRYAYNKGHDIEWQDGSPFCIHCRRAGWKYLDKLCDRRFES